MANNELTAKLNLDSSQFEKQLNKVVNRLDAINAAVQRMNSSLGEGDRAGQRLAKNAERVKRAEYEQWLAAQFVTRELQKTNPAMTALYTKANGVSSRIKDWRTSLEGFNKSLQNSNTFASGLRGKINRLASMYLGVMGTKAMINTSDTITGAENKLNNINAKTLGASGYNADGSYSQSTFNATQETMDKMYASAQKVRMGYGDMMSNVAKSMTLASGAFKGNIDNAIRFQEVMAEAYAVGGASAEEMSTSMYQMIQALGAGTLAGDELRSVREGAPLAYQAIEEFVQGVYNTEESLKDLASQGKVTSDMVVAAIMNSADELDASFAQTKQTFAQTWTQIKNAATKAFEPVSRMMREALNNAVNNGMIQKIESLFLRCAKALQITFALTEKLVNFIVDNWNWIQPMIIAGLILIAGYYTYMTSVAVASAVTRFLLWATEHQYIMLIVAAIALILHAFILWQQGAITTAELMVAVCLVIVAALIVVSVMTTNMVLLAIAGILLILTTAFYFFEQICGIFVGILYWADAACQNIANIWDNMCNSMAGFFWNAIASMLEGCDWLLKGINKIREALGKDAIDIGVIRAKANSYSTKKELIDMSANFNKGYQYGSNWASGVKGKVTDWVGNKLSGASLNDLGSKLGLDLTNQIGGASGLKPTSTEDLLGDINDKLGGVKGDTGSIKDSMELTEEDLKDFRKLANMDWRKEYTTAHIAVHMNNKNTINNKGDLDNWVISLRDMLTEEIDAVANGVYA